jgi:hypothetical protein
VTRAIVLPRLDGDLILTLLEQVEPIVAGEVLEELSAEAGRALMALGALLPNGAARTTMMAGDDSARFVDLDWLPDRNAYGYFDAADGVVVPDATSQALYRLNLSWWLSWLATALALTNAGRPAELVPGQAWDIGDLWITRQRKVPVLFARRLHLDEIAEDLRGALAKRISRSGGIILTSSRQPLATVAWPGSHQVMPICEALANDGSTFGIDVNLVRSPYLGVLRTDQHAAPLRLSPDGRTLVINGSDTVDFKSDAQVAIIRRLVDGFHAGERFRAIELLSNAKSGVGSLRRAFGTKKWAMLGKHLKSQDGLWGFDL